MHFPKFIIFVFPNFCYYFVWVFSLKRCIFALAVRELTKVQHLLNPMRELIYIQIQVKLHHNAVVCFCYITSCMGNSWLFAMKNGLNFATSPWLLLCIFLAQQWSILQSLQSVLQNCFTNSKSQLFNALLGISFAGNIQAVYLEREGHVMMGLAHHILPPVSEQKFITFSLVLLCECSQNTLGISLLLQILVLKLTDVVVWGKEI